MCIKLSMYCYPYRKTKKFWNRTLKMRRSQIFHQLKKSLIQISSLVKNPVFQ